MFGCLLSIALPFNVSCEIMFNAERTRVAVDLRRFYNQKPPKLAGEGSSVNRDGIQHTCDYSGRVMLLNCIML